MNVLIGIVKHVTDFFLSNDDECKTCNIWRYYQNTITCALKIQRHVQDYMLIFLIVYDVLKFSGSKYNAITSIMDVS